MRKPIAIIAGAPNSISSEIIFKCWKLRKKFKLKPFVIIGSISLLNLQKKKLKYKIPIKKVNFKHKNNFFCKNKLLVYDVNYNQKNAFQKISIKSNKYIFECFKVALRLVKKKLFIGLINCPISKETLFKKKHQGITEYLAKRSGSKEEVMLLYNKTLSVSPLTTHIPLKQVHKKINKIKIVKKILTINKFYKSYFK